MTAKFLNDQLIRSQRFGPGGAGAAKAENEGGTQAADGDLKPILKREDDHTRAQVYSRECQETERRRTEVIDQLDDRLHSLDKRRRQLEQARDAVAALPEKLAADQLRHAKRAVETAHLECVKEEQRDEEQRGRPGHQWQTMGFLKTAGIGLALTWPIVLALLVGAALIAFSVFAVFNI